MRTTLDLFSSFLVERRFDDGVTILAEGEAGSFYREFCRRLYRAEGAARGDNAA